MNQRSKRETRQIITAHQLLTLLKIRHAEDISDVEVYAPNESGTNTSNRRIDFLAIACSWARPVITGYEIKVSRQDFVRDSKWTEYLRQCNQLVFVTAQGVISTPSEIPDECGWQEASKNGVRLITRKKAPFRRLDKSHEAILYKHLLMRRSGRMDKVDEWKIWLQKRIEDRALGHLASREVRETLNAKVTDVEQQNLRLKRQNEALEKVEDVLKELGTSSNELAGVGDYGIQRKLRHLMQGQDASLTMDADTLARDLGGLSEQLSRAAKRVTAWRKGWQPESIPAEIMAVIDAWEDRTEDKAMVAEFRELLGLNQERKVFTASGN